MSLPYLILGQLNLKPLTGYDLNQAFEQSITHFWTTDQSQIYRALHKLHETRQVRFEVVHQDDYPDKKIYHITQSGRDALRTWLSTPIFTSTVRLPELGQIYFGSLLEPEQLLQLLETYIAEAHEFQQRYETLKTVAPLDQIDELPYEAQLPLMTLEYGLRRMAFERQWLEDIAAIVRKRLAR